jgi:hypothetical protein
MIFNQIYRILSLLLSALFIGIFIYASYIMSRRPDYVRIDLFELLLAFAFLVGALLITSFTILTWKYNKNRDKVSDIIDLPQENQTEQKLRASWLIYTFSAVNLIIGLTLVIAFCIILFVNFFNGRAINHISIIPLLLNLSILLFGMLQLIYVIKMILFHVRMKRLINP